MWQQQISVSCQLRYSREMAQLVKGELMCGNSRSKTPHDKRARRVFLLSAGLPFEMVQTALRSSLISIWALETRLHGHTKLKAPDARQRTYPLTLLDNNRTGPIFHCSYFPLVPVSSSSSSSNAGLMSECQRNSESKPAAALERHHDTVGECKGKDAEGCNLDGSMPLTVSCPSLPQGPIFQGTA